MTITPEYLAPNETLMDGAVYGVEYEIDSTSVMAWAVTRNELGQIDYKIEAVGTGSVEYEYGYTAAGQLETVTKDSVLVEDYSYDSQGRRAGDIDGRVYNYDNEDHLTSVVDGVKTTVYTHDVDGFLTMKEVDLDGDTFVDETTTYEYGARGELISVDSPGTTDDISYINGPSGQRLAKKAGTTIVEKYLWADLTTLLAVYDGSDSLLRRYEYAGGGLPVSFTDGTDTYYIHYDQVGSLRAVTDDQGTVVKEVVYDSFGNVIDDTAPTFEVDLGFAGGLTDFDTGLIRFGYRDYDPEVGRWTAKDPIGFGGGDTDLYAYCGNRPVTHVDPSGLYDFPYTPEEIQGFIDRLGESRIYDFWFHHELRAEMNGQLPCNKPVPYKSPNGEPLNVPVANFFGMPQHYEDVFVDDNGDFWLLMKEPFDYYHQPWLGRNSKFVGIWNNRGREAVYDPKGRLVTDELRGTFNFGDPFSDPGGHYVLDVKPHDRFGTDAIEGTPCP